MYGLSAVLAGLLVGTTASATTSHKNEVALSQRLSDARATIATLEELAKSNNPSSKSPSTWHNHWANWNNWNNWSNWSKHYRRNHH